MVWALAVAALAAGHQPDRIVEHGDHVREGVPEEAGDPHGHVDTRPGQFGQRDGAVRGLALDQQGQVAVHADHGCQVEQQVRFLDQLGNQRSIQHRPAHMAQLQSD